MEQLVSRTLVRLSTHTSRRQEADAGWFSQPLSGGVRERDEHLLKPVIAVANLANQPAIRRHIAQIMRLSCGEVDGGVGRMVQLDRDGGGGAEVPLCRYHGGVGLLQGLRGNRSFLLAQLVPPDLLSPDVGALGEASPV